MANASHVSQRRLAKDDASDMGARGILGKLLEGWPVSIVEGYPQLKFLT